MGENEISHGCSTPGCLINRAYHPIGCGNSIPERDGPWEPTQPPPVPCGGVKLIPTPRERCFTNPLSFSTMFLVIYCNSFTNLIRTVAPAVFWLSYLVADHMNQAWFQSDKTCLIIGAAYSELYRSPICCQSGCDQPTLGWRILLSLVR